MKTEKSRKHRRLWGVENSSLLRKHYEDKPIKDLVKLLDMSISSIYNKSRLLGLKKYKNQSL